MGLEFDQSVSDVERVICSRLFWHAQIHLIDDTCPKRLRSMDKEIVVIRGFVPFRNVIEVEIFWGPLRRRYKRLSPFYSHASPGL